MAGQAAELFDEPTTDDATPQEAASGQEAPQDATKGQEAAPAADPDGYEAPWLKDVLGGKYKTKADIEKGYGESSKQAREFKKAADEAEARWKGVEGIVGAPVGEDGKPAPYAFELPDGTELMPELMEAFQADLRELNLAPAVGQRVLNRYLAVEAGIEEGRRTVERDFVVQQIGAGDEGVAKAQVGAALEWARGLLGDSPDVEEMLTGNGGISSYGKSLAVLCQLHARQSGVSLGSSSGTGGFGDADYQALLSKGHLTGEEAAKVASYLNSKFPDTPV